jgi:PTH1 family peptidyl-tRNA hydrolase
MKLIVGLGNPGKEYEKTRHNVGFMVIDKYCNNEKFSEKFNGLYINKVINGEKVIFLKPLSFMNLSGTVVKAFQDYYKIENKDILIIRDDLDIPLGHAKLKFNSSSGGDNGVKSIINSLRTQAFCQFKIGISQDKTVDTKDYVLGKFSNLKETKLEASTTGSSL